MRIEEDEHIGCPIALMLTVVTLDLARRRRDRLADLADELGRTLVETDDRVLRIGLFCIEVEHTPRRTVVPSNSSRRVCGVGKEEKPSWWWRTRQGQYA